MKLLKRILIYIVIFLMSVTYSNSYSQRVASDDQVKEIQSKLDEIKALKKGKPDAKPPVPGLADNDEKIIKLAQEAIDLTDKYFNIPDDNASGKPKYDPNEPEQGNSRRDGKKVKVTLGPEALSDSATFLATVKTHELIGHGSQAAAGNWYVTPKGMAIQEIEAYEREKDSAKRNGLSQRILDDIQNRIDNEYKKLDAANKKKIDNKNYLLSLVPPTKKRSGVLVTRSEVFVAGSVLTEERMKVTVTGEPKLVEGMVVQAEINGKKTETRPDKNGHAIIDFAVLTAGVAGSAVAIIKMIDSRGKIIDQKNTTVLSGTPMIFSRPVFETLPPNVETNSVITIPGQNLGADANMVFGDQIQETLSASDREMTIFVDCVTGNQPAYIITPNGVSESQTVNVYSMNFTIAKTTITSGEHISGQVQYESLPIGTELIFTNNSPSVINLSIKNAATSGNKTIFKVTQTSGTIPCEIIGRGQGNFSVSADPNFH